MLENKFKTLCQNFSKDTKLISLLWQEIKVAYSEPARHYHTLQHLEHIYKELHAFELSPLLEFAIFYHDIVYDVLQNNNEEISTLHAMKYLNLLGANKTLKDELLILILETKTHNASNEKNKLFLDADLSILGSSEKNYKKYIQNIRKEYALYDDSTYFAGRKKVLKMFLEKSKIYQTKHFYDKYEKQARVNMLIEYNSLI
jgi:predicted metal-dependent HD superfamily phosphohydrolase